jgi:acyl transferase domain-containing protein
MWSGMGGEIAVIGVSCRFPGADGPAALWRSLCAGVDAIGVVPADRWAADIAPGTGVELGGFLDGVDRFDAGFFGISPREAAGMDPQQRLVLELAWEALEDAGTLPAALRGSRAALYVGVSSGDYSVVRARGAADRADPFAMTGLNRAMIANRASYFLGIDGPSAVIDTGQSSSLVAVHSALSVLLQGDARIALAGGVHLNLAAESAVAAAGFGALSPDGRSRAFDAAANGHARGEGGGLVVLKRLADALADGDTVHCVLRGGATAHGGGAHLTTPDAEAQERLLRAAYRDAGVDPAHVQYVELHGTGTTVGDPVEAAALGAVLGAARTTPLSVGSVKTNIGHLEAAAGVAGLIKVVLGIRHRRVPASLHFTAPPPSIPLERLNLRVQVETGPWADAERPLVAGVSSFGMGGANCHLVVAEHAGRDEPAGNGPAGDVRRVLPFPLSAKTPEALREHAARLHAHVAADPGAVPADIAYSLATTRTAFAHRAVLVAADRDGLLAESRALADGGAGRAAGAPGGLALLFSGQGSQHAGMAAGLRAEFPVFAAAFDEAAAHLDPALDRPLAAVVSAEPGSPDAALLDQTAYTQSALFAVEVALHRLVRSWGVVPDFLAGHSVGEIAAAHAAGVLSLPDACALVSARGRLMQALPAGGAMVAVEASEEDVVALLAGREAAVALAAVNGPRATVVSGDEEAVLAVAAALADAGHRTKRLAVSHAFHSPRMDPALAEFRTVAEGLTHHDPAIPVVSTVDGNPVERFDADHWVRQAREPVRFLDAVRGLHERGVRAYVELGPGGVLSAAARDCLGPDAADALLAPALRRGADDVRSVTRAVGDLHAHGHDVDWHGVFAGLPVRRVPLPTYAFQRERHWFDATPAPARTSTVESAVEGVGDRARVERVVREQVALVLGHAGADSVDPGTSFRELGLGSLTTVELCDRVNQALGTAVPAAALYDHSTAAALAAHLIADAPRADAHQESAQRESTQRESAQRESAQQESAAPDEPIAIVAMACRYPGGVRTPEQLWELVAEGRDAVSGFPRDRGWDLDRLFAEDAPGSTYAREGGFLADADRFDAEFFGISPREALAMDPQQRLLLETAWESFERAGIDPASAPRVGVFVGVTAQEYGPRLHESAAGVEGHLLTGVSPSVASGRIAYTFGFDGPAVTVDTACSSSLVAVHLAARALRQGDCALAVAGGAAVMAAPGMFVEFARQGGLARDGRCKAFSADADGTGWAEGAGVLLLERLSDARRAGHPVLAVLRGTAVNNDGRSNGLTAPSGLAQQDVARRALAEARLTPDQVDLVEAHGTGTVLGDAIEAAALAAVYGGDRPAGRPLLVGSLKSNIGHTQAAAGVAGVIKTVLAMRHGIAPRTLHAGEPTSQVDWAASGMALLTESRPWESDGGPRRAAVSSFGISGTNAHAVIEEVQREESAPAAPDGPPVPLVLSAKGGAALRTRASDLLALLDDTDPVDLARALADVPALSSRAVVVGRDRDEVAVGLRAVADGDPGALTGTAADGKLAFLFSGQGSQCAGMGAELHARYPVFAAAFDRVCAALDPHLDRPVKTVVFSGDSEVLERTEYAQPALFAVEVALFRLLEHWGVRPDFVIGHSVGEFAAAHVAGALSLEEACALVAARGRLMQAQPGGGAMAAIEAAEEDVLASLTDRVVLAAVNGPRSVVVSGDADAVAAVVEEWARRGARTRELRVSHAFHSPHVDGALDGLRAATAVTPRPLAVPLVSTLTGGPVTGDDLADPEHWASHARRPVRFHDGVRWLAEHGVTAFLEVGPDGALAAAADGSVGSGGSVGEGGEGGEGGAVDSTPVVVAAQRRGRPQAATLVAAVGRLHAAGVPVDLARVVGSPKRPVVLPTYPFQDTRYWLPPGSGRVDRAALGLGGDEHPLVGAVVDLPDGSLAGTGAVSLSTHPWLADHVVSGRVVVPATVFVELVAQVSGLAVAELIVSAPLVLAEEGAVVLRVVADPPDEGGAREVRVHSRQADGGWSEHAGGRVAPPTGEPGETADLGTWPPEGAEEVPVDAVYADLARAGLAYGPSFRGMTRVWRVGDDVCAELALPDGLAGAARGCAVHPALLDAALHPAGVLGFFGGDGAPVRLPFAWSGVRVHARGAAAARVRVCPRGRDTVALRLADAAGLPVAEVDSLVVRALPTGRADALLRLSWEPVEADRADAVDWALLGDDIRITGAIDAPRRVTELAELDVVPPVVVASVSADTGAVPGAVARTCHRVLALVRAWLEEERFAGSRLVVLTRGAVEVDRPDLALAAAWGLVRSAQRENPDRLLLVDIDDDPRSAARLADAAAAGEPQLAIRAGELLAPRLARSAASAAAPAGWAGGTVLVTGASGALGALVVRRLVERHGVRRLLLVSRRGADAPGARELSAAVAELGAAADWAARDVGDRDAVAALLASVPAEHPLSAVVHVAGVLDDGVVGALTPRRVDAVLRPKADAAWHLHELTRESGLGAFVLFSSASGVFGAAGQANYAAANSFLDALARHRRSLGLAATSVAWAPWASAGMAGGLDARDQARLAGIGMAALSDEDGLALFDAALGADEPAVVALRVDVPALRLAPGELPPPLLRGLVRVPRAAPARAARPALADMGGPERARAVLDLVRAEVAAVLDHAAPGRVDVRQGFRDLGVDSLTGVELRNRLAKATGLALSPTAVFDHPTPEVLARHLLDRLAPEPADTPGPAAEPGGLDLNGRDRADADLADAELIDELDVDDLIRLARESLG